MPLRCTEDREESVAHSEGRALHLFGRQSNWKERSRLERGGWARTGAGHRALSVLWSLGDICF